MTLVTDGRYCRDYNKRHYDFNVETKSERQFHKPSFLA